MSSEKPEQSNPSVTPEWKLEIHRRLKICADRIQTIKLHYPDGISMRQVGGYASVVVTLIWLASGIYKVEHGSQAVVTRFGLHVKTTQAGLHWHLPAPIEKVNIVNVVPRAIEIGGNDLSYANKLGAPQAENLLPTHDNNLLSARLSVHYQIQNAADYLFNLKNSEVTLKQLAESALFNVIAQNDLAFLLKDGRNHIGDVVKVSMQKALNDYRSGIVISDVNVLGLSMPEDVRASFDDVSRAADDKKRLIDGAEAYKAEVMPKANAAAMRIIEEARAYVGEKVAKAQGETQRFELMLTEYEKNPALTRKRLFLETKEQLYANSHKILIDGPQGQMVQLNLPAANQVIHNTPLASDPDLAAHGDNDHAAKDKIEATKSRNVRPSRSKP